MLPSPASDSAIPAVHRSICAFRRAGLVPLAGARKIPSMKHRSRGMTLLELMMALAVVAVLTAIAVPGIRQFMSNSRTTATTNDLVSALNLARSEALRRTANAVVCASDDQETCSGGTDWATGWIAFTDPNANGEVDDDELLR